MKNLLLILLLFVSETLYAQDSLRITYTQEQDTLEKQRFIDRYENVFMTKVPSRHMLKLSLTFSPNYLFAIENSSLQNTAYGIGYEYKLLPSLSLGSDISVSGGWGGATGYTGTLSANVYGRWYYDMKRRIREGVSVNNFTGNYLAVVAERRWGKAEVDYQLSRIGIEFGLQRRFLNNGRMEFAIGLSYQKYLKGYYPSLLVYGANNKDDFAIASRTSMGLAFGDWKRNKKIALCEILRCDESHTKQWKLLWPRIYLSSQFIQGTAGISYERKFGSKPISVNAQLITDYMRITSKIINATTEQKLTTNDIQIWPSIQLRYYVGQKEALRNGTGGNNLSGIYAGPHSDFVYYKSQTIFSIGRPARHLGLGAVAGYQQTLFKKAYVDVSANLSYNLLKPKPDTKQGLLAVRTGFGLVF